MPTRPIPPLLEQLRNSTKAAHANLDTAFNLEQITSSPAACEAYLLKFSKAFQVVAKQIDWNLAASLELPDLPARRGRYGQLPSAPFTYGDSTISETVGTLYVLEGSVHGGGQILRRIHEKHPDAQLAGGGFLRGFGEKNPIMWRAFVSWLGGLKLSPEEMAGCCAIACETFEVFERYLNDKTS
ncbi:biliverdin-producing heme oxygenase [Luteolibacter algae]|uniref:Biliverdin-producing heme oxygenase n=1 Tax=Luteolibacter algae TaxID=454151 RepID=A0ABW5D9G6_9BACT